MAANQSIPTSVLNSIYFDAFYALDSSYFLHQMYVTELKRHNVVPSSLPLNLGEGGHFKHLKKPRGTSRDIQDFLTLSYKGGYALFLGTSIMLECTSMSSEKDRLLNVKFDLGRILTRIYVQLITWDFPVPKTDEKVDKDKLRKRLLNLIDVFLQDKHIRALIPHFQGEKTLLLKWELNIEYIACLSDFMSKVKGTNGRRYTV